MYYVQEADKLNVIFKLFNIVELKDDKIILPIRDEKISIKKAEKLGSKILKILNKTNCNKIVLSKKIKEKEEIKNYLYSNQINIVKPDILTEILVINILEFIEKKKKLKPENITISILINDITINMLENIKIIAKKYKRLNIVTNHTQKFKKLEKDFFEEEGVIITINNNKKKSLSKSNIILNVDFPNELINLYTIYDEAIVINLKDNVKITKKRFKGININDYDIDFDYLEEFDYEKDKLYDKKDIYEAEFIKNQPFKYSIKDLEKYNVKIKNLYGTNSEI